MATLVEGLRPINEKSGTGAAARKEGRQPVAYTNKQSVSLRPQAAPVDTYVKPRADPSVGQGAMQLAEVLSSVSPKLAKYAADQEKKKEDEQMEKLSYYTEVAAREFKEGTVNATQVKELFPELSPTVASRVSQSIGAIHAKEWTQTRIQEVLENDNIRLDTAARRKYLEELRQEALTLAKDQEFYGGGFLSQVTKSLNEFETAWMRETATYHEKVQAEAFTDQVTSILQSGGDLEALDEEWKSSSSLNNIERNKLVMEAALSIATANNDASVLKNLPKRFLNAEAKANITKVEQQIASARFAQWSRAKEMENWRRAEEERNMKIAINERAANGELINPAEFYKYPGVYDHALRIATAPMVNPTQSSATATNFRSGILRAGVTGDFLGALQNDPNFANSFRNNDEITEQSLVEHIVSRTDLTSKDRTDLLNEIPQLMGGMNFMRDPDVKENFETFVGADMRALLNGPFARAIQANGVNIQGEIQRAYYTAIQQGVMDYLEEHNALPRGAPKREIIEKATAKAEAKLKSLQNFTGGRPAPATPEKPEAKPTKSPKEGGGEYITLPNGMRIKKVE